MRPSKNTKTGLEMNYKTKQDKILVALQKELDEFKRINAENKEKTEELIDQKLDYELLTKSFIKSVPFGMFT